MPKHIVLTGFMGAGKSTVGVRLARSLGWGFIDLDEEIVRTEKMSIAEIFETAGEAVFRGIENRALANALRNEKIVLALGGGALETEANRDLLAANEDTWLVYLEAPLEKLIARCEQQQASRPESARRPVLEQKAELAGRFLRRQPLYESAHWTIHTADHDTEEIVQRILRYWKLQAEASRT